MKFKKFVTITGLGLALSFASFAQTTVQPASAQSPVKMAAPPDATPLPTSDQILDHYLQAVGGRDAWMKLTSRVSTGTIDIPAANISGTLDLKEKAPNQTLAVVTLGGAAFRQAFDGKVGWSDDPRSGLRELSGDELEETRRDADFSHPVDMRILYKKFVVLDAEKVDEHDAFLMEVTPENGAPEKMYFDSATGLLIRVVSQRHTPDGVTPIQIDVSDYREVDGIMLPFSIHQAAGEMEFTMKLNEIHHNVDIDSAQFSKPAAQ
jgi:zinc protease